MFQFFQMLLGYHLPQIGKECNKNMNWGQGQSTFDTKMRRKYPYILFLYWSPYFFNTHAQTCQWPHIILLSKFSAQVKLTEFVVGVSC